MTSGGRPATDSRFGWRMTAPGLSCVLFFLPRLHSPAWHTAYAQATGAGRDPGQLGGFLDFSESDETGIDTPDGDAGEVQRQPAGRE